MSRRIILWSVAAVLGIAATAIAIVRIGGSNRSQSVQPKIVLSHVSEVVSSDPSQGSQARGPAEIIRFRLTTIYDLAGRVTSITTPDSAVVTTSYSANTVTVTNQASK